MKYIKEIIPYVIIIIIVVLIRTFIITPVRVDGDSMHPTLLDGEILLLKKYDKKFERFDIVVFEYDSSKLVKRIIGLPGDKVEYKNNTLYINNEIIEEVFLDEDVKTSNFSLTQLELEKIPEDYYFVIGDNRNNSTDSRIIGPVHKKYILGTSDFALFPFKKFGKVD